MEKLKQFVPSAGRLIWLAKPNGMKNEQRCFRRSTLGNILGTNVRNKETKAKPTWLSCRWKVRNLNFLLGESQVMSSIINSFLIPVTSVNYKQLSFFQISFLLRLHWCASTLKTEIIRPFEQSYQSQMLCVSISKDRKDKKIKQMCLKIVQSPSRQLKEPTSKVLKCLSEYRTSFFQSQSCNVNCFALLKSISNDHVS